MKSNRAAANMGYTTMRGAVLRMTVLCKVEQLCFVLKFSGNNPALHVAPKRWHPLLRTHETTINIITEADTDDKLLFTVDF